MIGNIVGAVTGVVSSAIKAKSEKALAKHQLHLAVMQNKARLATAETEANSEWEMAQLEDKDRFLRWFSYTMFTAPIVITVLAPEYGRRIFENLEYVPEWMVQVFVAMNGAVWGLSSLKNVVPTFVGQLKGKK
jgi:hypothetical protein